MAVLLISSILLVILVFKFPKSTFLMAFSSQFVWLPIQITLNGSDLGLLVIGLQSICILTLILTNFREILSQHKFEILIASLLGILGILMKSDDINWLTSLLGIKFILAPIVISFAYQFGREFRRKLISTIFVLQVLNFLAGILELQLGIKELQSLGFEYGTNIRNFKSGTLRVPGLAITNFDLGLTSGVVLSLVYFMINGRIEIGKKYNHFFLILVFTSSIGGILVSYSRSGAIFAATVIVLAEAFERKRFLKAQTLFLTLTITGLLLISRNVLFSDNSSFLARFELWEDLPKLSNPMIGRGVGALGAVTKSSYTNIQTPIVVDNYFISIYLQLGILGLAIFSWFLVYLIIKGNSYTRALIFGLIVTLQFVELWEYALPTSLILFMYYSFSRQDSSEFFKAKK